MLWELLGGERCGGVEPMTVSFGLEIWCAGDVYLVGNGICCAAVVSLSFADLLSRQLRFAEGLELAIKEPCCSFRRHRDRASSRENVVSVTSLEDSARE